MEYTIFTNRLNLRAPTLTDIDALFKLMSDNRITTFLTWEAHLEKETTATVVTNLIQDQANDKGYHWCVCINKEIIGIASLIDVRRKIRTWTQNRAELSYWISPEFQNKGYATEASQAVIEFGFEKLNFHKIIVAHANRNIESKSICSKLGFKQYAYEHDAFLKNGKWNDLYWYEKIKSE